jgi:hypothetical protein
VTELARLTRNYRTAFLRYLSRRDEVPLNAGYELGRSAVAAGISILDLARVHHVVLLEVLMETPRDDLNAVGTAAGDFFVEVLATYDMAQRGFLERS